MYSSGKYAYDAATAEADRRKRLVDLANSAASATADRLTKDEAIDLLMDMVENPRDLIDLQVLNGIRRARWGAE